MERLKSSPVGRKLVDQGDDARVLHAQCLHRGTNDVEFRIGVSAKQVTENADRRGGDGEHPLRRGGICAGYVVRKRHPLSIQLVLRELFACCKVKITRDRRQ